MTSHPKPVEPVIVVVPVAVADAVDDLASIKATIFQDNYLGASKKLGPGRYNATAMGIGDNTLSSIKVPEVW